MREIVLDTETTGLDPLRGDRLVEIGCVEIFNRMPTGQIFHRHINPERDMPAEAFAVHGLSTEFLADKPLFAHVVDEFLEFIGDAPLVIHNASFDISFINAELDRIKRPAIARDRLVDTLLLARRKHPGVSNRLDDLCSRYAIDNSRRTKHGALLDAELLAEVYIDLIGARQSQLILAAETRETRGGGYGEMPRRQREVPLVPRISEEDRAAHRAFIATLGDKPIWNDFLGVVAEPLAISLACAALGGGLSFHVLAIQADEIHGVEHQGREAAVAHGGRNDLAREREQQPRAFDHDQRMQVFLRHVQDAEYPGIGEVEAEHHLAGVFRLALDRQRHFVLVFGDVVGADVDLDVDRRLLLLRRQRTRCVRILERQVLGVLRQHVELGEGPLREVRRCRWSWKSLLERFQASGDRSGVQIRSGLGKMLLTGRVANIAPPSSTRTTMAPRPAAPGLCWSPYAANSRHWRRECTLNC